MTRKEIQKEYHEYLLIKNYREQSKKTYLSVLNSFLTYCINHKEEYEGIQLYAKSYILHRIHSGKSWSTINIDYSALRILCKHVLKQEWSYTMLPRPNQLRQLPYVLSGKQIESMINSIKNIKHKTIVTLLYSTGIRASELINLNVSDFCNDRHHIRVTLGKGGKDRLVQLPSKMVHMLRAYLSNYNPKQFLFEGQPKDKRYSHSSMIKIIKRAANKVGIPQSISSHTLRHTYATHHLVNGTDLATLQMQMGHKNIKTTIKYIHLCPVRHRHINHPIDKLHINIATKQT